MRRAPALRRALSLAGSRAGASALDGCLGCALVAELAGSARARGADVEALALEAASYATTASLGGCARCSQSLDLLCEAGLYSRSRAS